MNDEYLDMMRQYMGMNNRFTSSDLNGMGTMLQPIEFYQDEIPKTAFDSETLAAMIIKYSHSGPANTEILERVLKRQQYIEFDTRLSNCLPAGFFEPYEIHASAKRFEVTWERFHEYCKQHAFSVATIIDSPRSRNHSFDIIFIESSKHQNSMTPFVYTDSFRRSVMGLNGPMHDEIVHTFKNEYTDWSFCIVRTVTINATQRVTSLPTSPVHPTLQGVIDQNEIARIIKQFTDDLDNGAYHIE